MHDMMKQDCPLLLTLSATVCVLLLLVSNVACVTSVSVYLYELSFESLNSSSSSSS